MTANKSSASKKPQRSGILLFLMKLRILLRSQKGLRPGQAEELEKKVFQLFAETDLIRLFEDLEAEKERLLRDLQNQARKAPPVPSFQYPLPTNNV